MKYSRDSCWERLDKETVFSFCEKYKLFMQQSKNERFCIKNIIYVLETAGFHNISSVSSVSKGDKIYRVFKDKTVMAAIIGDEELRIIGSHVDSPRLDLKPHPLYEESNIALLQTHYYGGIKKYQWVNVPLVLTGVVYTKDGKKIDFNLGEKEDEPIFIIPDLLPHLAQDQMKKDAPKIIEGEQLNVVFGNIPLVGEEKQKVKMAVLEKLNTEYGIVEEDFTVAELEFVPAHKPRDVGIDRSMIAAYAHDDKVSVYTSLMALIHAEPTHTAIGMFVDKEEIGSVGDTGAESFILLNFIEELRKICSFEKSSFKLLEEAKSISADVTAAVDPTHKDAHEKQNGSLLGSGVSVEKYGGSRGKSGSHDTRSEYMQEMRMIIEKNNIPWQTGELGKIDCGGGGTIAMFMSRYGMDCVDAGIPVLAMHAPYELASKGDIYCAYLLYKAFFNT